MSDTIGVPGELIPEQLKQLALFFDRIAIVELSETIRLMYTSANLPGLGEMRRNAAELELLQDKGIVFEPRIPSHDIIIEDTSDLLGMKDALAALESLITARNSVSALTEVPSGRRSGVSEPLRDAAIKWVQARAEWHRLVSRVVATQIRKRDGLIAYPVFDTPERTLTQRRSPQSTVTEIVLRKLPVPTSNVPWEAVFDFRNDEVAHGLLLRLRVWLNEIARSQRSAGEVQE
jgi:hypothetical protein